MRFRLTDENGTTWIVKKKEKDWEKNFPDFVTIDPRGELIISENSDDAKEKGI